MRISYERNRRAEEVPRSEISPGEFYVLPNSIGLVGGLVKHTSMALMLNNFVYPPDYGCQFPKDRLCAVKLSDGEVSWTQPETLVLRCKQVGEAFFEIDGEPHD